jgi:hypothetical protein
MGRARETSENLYFSICVSSTIDLIFKGERIKKVDFSVDDISVRKHRQVHLKFHIPDLNSLKTLDKSKIILD